MRAIYKREVFMAKTVILPNTVSEKYKTTSIALNNVELSNKCVIKKSLIEIMKQSFFHGSGLYGPSNFIA